MQMTRRTLVLLTLALTLSPPVFDAKPKPTPTPKPAAQTQNAKTGASDGAARAEPSPSPAQPRAGDGLKPLEEAVKDVGNRVDALGTKVDRINIPEPPPDYERWGVLAALGLMLAGLAALGYLTWKANRRIRRAVELRNSAGGQGAVSTHSSASSLNSLQSSFESALAAQKEELLKEVRALRQAVGELSVKTEGGGGDPRAELASSPEEGDGLQLGYPASVDDCINQLRNAQVTLLPVRPDLSLYGNLSENEDNKFWLARGGTDSEYLLFPKARRFGSGDEFHTFYENYYECAEPSAGDVSIIRPSVVMEDETNGGWKLKKKGLLKVV